VVGTRAARVVLLALAGVTASACASDKVSRDRALRKSIAMEFIAQRNWSAAFAKVRDLYEEDPNDADVLTMRGTLYREQGMQAEAEADLRAALAVDEERADAHSALAVLLESQNRGAEALEHHRLAAEISPKSPELLNNLGFALFARNQIDEAVSTFNEALRLNPANPRVRNNLGFALARRGDFGRAAREFASGGTPAQAKNNLGFAYERAGNLALAYDLYKQALELDPGLRQARTNLTNVAKAIGRPGPDELGLVTSQGGQNVATDQAD
jgi:Flp pilus assembly protein TadD